MILKNLKNCYLELYQYLNFYVNYYTIFRTLLGQFIHLFFKLKYEQVFFDYLIILNLYIMFILYTNRKTCFECFSKKKKTFSFGLKNILMF